MENSELERIADEKMQKALVLKIDEKAAEIVYSLGSKRNRQSRNSLQDYFEEHLFPSLCTIRFKNDGTYVRESAWHKEKGFRIFVEDYWNIKKDESKYESKSVEICFNLRKRLFNLIPVKIRTLVYSHEIRIHSYPKETEKENIGFHTLSCFRKEDVWLKPFEELYEKAKEKGIEKAINQIEKDGDKQNKKLKERFGIQ